MSCFRSEADAIVLAVRLTPKGGRDQIDGIGSLADGRQIASMRVRAVAEDGAANAALVALLAKTFGRPTSAVTILAGTTARIKQVRINGDPKELAAIVESWPQR